MIEKLLDETYWHETETYIDTNSESLGSTYQWINLKTRDKETIISLFLSNYIGGYMGTPRVSETTLSEESRTLLKDTLNQNMSLAKDILLKAFTERLFFDDGEDSIQSGFTKHNIPQDPLPMYHEVCDYFNHVSNLEELMPYLMDQIIINGEVWKTVPKD